MPRTIVFDVNETLLDMRVLDKLFKRHLGSDSLRATWFTQVINTAITATIVGAPYRHFGQVGAAALQMVAKRNHITLSDDALRDIPKQMLSLPPYPDVPVGLKRLKEAGFQTVALTNSPLGATRAQLEAGGLMRMLDQVLSVEAVGVFKPDARVYQMAARELGLETSDLLMVASHDWDIAGAMAVGYSGAFIARPGQVTNPYFDKPDIVANDIQDAAEQIIAIHR